MLTAEKIALLLCVEQDMVKIHGANFLISEKFLSVQTALLGPHHLRAQQIASGEAQHLATAQLSQHQFVPYLFSPFAVSPICFFSFLRHSLLYFPPFFYIAFFLLSFLVYLTNSQWSGQTPLKQNKQTEKKKRNDQLNC